jgi:hypothetical protein
MNSLSNDEVIEQREKMTQGDQGNEAEDEVDDLFWVIQIPSILEVIVGVSG